MPGETAIEITQAERTDEKLVRGIGIPALTANIVSSTIGAGIFVIPAAIAKGLGPAAPLAFVCCAIAMLLFVTCFAIAGSRVSLTGGLYAYVEVAFGRYVGFLAGILYFLTALGAVAGVVNVLANSVALVVPFLGSPMMRIVVMLVVYGSLVLINIRGVREGAGAVTVITVAKLLPLLLFICAGLFFIDAPNLSWGAWPSSKSLGDAVILLMFAFVGAHIGRQFEFVQSQWINDGIFFGAGEDKDPIIGSGEINFTLPRKPVRRRLQGIPNFVITRGGEYCFMPGLRALRWLSDLQT